MIMFIGCLALLLTIHSLTTHSLIEIYLMAIELGAIYAGEEYLSTYTYTARTTHTRAIDHQRIERYGCRQRVLLRGERHELHHNHRADGYTLVVALSFVINQILDFGRNHTLETARAIICGDIQIICNLGHLLGIYQHRGALCTDNNIGLATVLIQPLYLRIYGSSTYATRNKEVTTALKLLFREVNKLRRVTQRACKIGYIIAFTKRAQLTC